MSNINTEDNITLENTNIKFSCQGCIYEKSPTAINLNKPNPCSICARNYKDKYKSTAVPLKKIRNKYHEL